MSASTLAVVSDRSVTLTTSSLQIFPPNHDKSFLLLQNEGPSVCAINLAGGPAIIGGAGSINMAVNDPPIIFQSTVPKSAISAVSAGSSKLTVLYSGPPAGVLEADGVALGDSFTNNVSFPESVFWPAQLQNILNNQGANTVFTNLGHSGMGSAHALYHAKTMTIPPRPTFGIIYVGNNDTNVSNIGIVQAAPAPTTTTFTLDAGKTDFLTAGASVFVGVEPTHVIQGISGNQVTLVTALSGAPVAGTQVIQDTATNIVAASNQLLTNGFTRQIICVNHYMNWTAGFNPDTISTEAPSQVPNPRTPQRAAAATQISAIGAVLSDFYQYMRLRIVNGQDVQGSASWHVADGDVHLNPYGENILAQGIRSVMPPAWIASIT